jgi:serine/threonine-protein kinase
LPKLKKRQGIDTSPRNVQPASEEVESELEKILASRIFATSERMGRFLRFGVKQALMGKSGEIKEYVVGMAVFDRPESYDQRADPVVRVEARRLRSKLREYYQVEGAADPVVIEFPVGGYVPVFSRRPLAASTARPLTWTWRRIGLVAALAIAACAALLTAPKWTASSRYSVAVLPFVDLTPSHDQGYVCDGLTDELIATLSRIDGLRVPARTSVFQLRAADLRTIEERLRVTTALEGSVQKEGERLRITVQLIRLSDNSHLWSETYDSVGKGLFAIEDEISRSVMSRLGVTSKGRLMARQRTTDVGTHNLYLRGRQALYEATPAATVRANNLFQQALMRDSNYAEALAGLADSYSKLVVFGQQRGREAYPKAIAAAERAIALQESLPEAHRALANARLEYAWDWAASDWEHRRTLELNPNDAVAHEEYGWQLMYQGRFDAAIREGLRAQELDPLSPRVSRSLATTYYHARRYDDAIAQCRRALQLDPGFIRAYHTLARAYTQKSMFDEAVAASHRWATPAGAFLGYTYAVSGRRKEAEQIIERLKQAGAAASFSLATVYAGLGDRDHALQCLEEAYASGEFLLTVKVNPEFDVLRSDPRFPALLKKIGLNP